MRPGLVVVSIKGIFILRLIWTGQNFLVRFRFQVANNSWRLFDFRKNWHLRRWQRLSFYEIFCECPWWIVHVKVLMSVFCQVLIRVGKMLRCLTTWIIDERVERLLNLWKILLNVFCPSGSHWFSILSIILVCIHQIGLTVQRCQWLTFSIMSINRAGIRLCSIWPSFSHFLAQIDEKNKSHKKREATEDNSVVN